MIFSLSFPPFKKNSTFFITFYGSPPSGFCPSFSLHHIPFSIKKCPTIITTITTVFLGQSSWNIWFRHCCIVEIVTIFYEKALTHLNLLSMLVFITILDYLVLFMTVAKKTIVRPVCVHLYLFLWPCGKVSELEFATFVARLVQIPSCKGKKVKWKSYFKIYL